MRFARPVVLVMVTVEEGEDARPAEHEPPPRLRHSERTREELPKGLEGSRTIL